MDEIRTNAANPSPIDHGASNRGVQNQTGSFKSATVAKLDVNSMIADAAEELTFAHQEDSERDVSKREVEAGRKSESLERVTQVPEIQKLLKSLGDLEKRALFRGLKALLKQQSRDPDELGRRTKEQFKEPSHQYAALKMLAEALKARGAPAEEIAAAEKAADDLMAEQGVEIRAALNIGTTAQGYAKDDLGSIPDLRDAYTTNVKDYKATSAVLNDLIKRFGPQKLEQSISFMLNALGQDLEAGGSSIDKTQLGLIMADMNRLKSLTTILGNCTFLVANAQKMGAKETYDAIALLRDLVPLQDSPRVQKNQMTALPEKAGLDDIGAQIRFLSDLREVIRLIPLEAYAKPESREKMMDAVQDALTEKGDLEIEMEEDEYDEYD